MTSHFINKQEHSSRQKYFNQAAYSKASFAFFVA